MAGLIFGVLTVGDHVMKSQRAPPLDKGDRFSVSHELHITPFPSYICMMRVL